MHDVPRGWRLTAAGTFRAKRDGRKGRGRARATSRDPHWDNIRYLSGTLVVFVHLMNTVADRDGLRWLYVATWAMRVPVFVLVAGYFSQAGALTPREARRLIESIAVPYLAIGLLHTVQVGLFLGGEWSFHLLDPAWGMWFLLSLLCWRMALPYLAQLRYPVAASVLVALVSGYVSDFGTFGSLSRTLAFLPFFLVGWRIRQGLFAGQLRAAWSRHAALAVLGVTFVVAWFIRAEVHFNWLRMKGPYADGDPLNGPLAWVTRAVVLSCGVVIALSFIRLVPSRRVPVLTYLGAGGLYTYLLHPLALRPVLREWGVGWVGPWPEQILLLALAMALSATLASPPVRRLARPLIQPRLPWLFTRRAAEHVTTEQPVAEPAREAARSRQEERTADPGPTGPGNGTRTAPDPVPPAVRPDDGHAPAAHRPTGHALRRLTAPAPAPVPAPHGGGIPRRR